MCVSSARLLDQRQPQAEYPWSNHPSCAGGDNACVSPLESWAKYARGKHCELCCSVSESYSGSQFLVNPKKKREMGLENSSDPNGLEGSSQLLSRIPWSRICPQALGKGLRKIHV